MFNWFRKPKYKMRVFKSSTGGYRVQLREYETGRGVFIMAGRDFETRYEAWKLANDVLRGKSVLVDETE